MSRSLGIADTTPNATIHYTTDGSTPTAASTVYTGALSISSIVTVNAIATAPGYTNSVVATVTYTFPSSGSGNSGGGGGAASPVLLGLLGAAAAERRRRKLRRA